MNDVTRPASLYQYFDRNGLLLYVGITSRGISRNREHNADKSWWKYVARQEVAHFPDRASAISAEKALIVQRRPPFNKQHNLEHESLVQAYEAFAKAQAEARSAGNIMQEMKGRLPLKVTSWERNLLRVKSAPEFIRLTSRLLEPESLRIQLRGFSAPCVSFSRNDFGVEMFFQGSWLWAVESMEGIIGGRKGNAYYMRSVEVKTKEGALNV